MKQFVLLTIGGIEPVTRDEDIAKGFKSIVLYQEEKMIGGLKSIEVKRMKCLFNLDKSQIGKQAIFEIEVLAIADKFSAKLYYRALAIHKSVGV